MSDFEDPEVFEECYNFKTGTYKGTRNFGARIEQHVKWRKRFDRLIIEGIVVIDTTVRPEHSFPLFIPAGEPERIWRASEGKDPKWRVASRCFVWEEGAGKESKWAPLTKRLHGTQIMWGRIRRAIRR